jgi:hypothetical protein
MKVEDCIWELKIHGMAEQILSSNGEIHWVMTKKAVSLITVCWGLMSERFPDATEEQVTTRALIVVVLEKLGWVNRRNLPDYIAAIKSLAANGKEP